jgi:hypothetical protein
MLSMLGHSELYALRDSKIDDRREGIKEFMTHQKPPISSKPRAGPLELGKSRMEHAMFSHSSRDVLSTVV